MVVSTTLTFPHTELTLIDKKPTNSTLQRLQRELYANARSIPSARGGGNDGHLALLMNNVDYQARAGQLFIIPIHPGAAPHHLANATGPQIAETIRLFNQNIAEHTLYHAVATAIKAQLLHAVDNTYLRSLEDADFGFADVTPEAMLNHLKLEYGQLTPEALEINRAALSEPWNPEEPLENLWKKITEIQRVATAGVAPITDIAIITLTLAMFEKSGLLMLTIQQWRLRPMVQWTLVTFKTDFTLANTERIRQETAGSAGYHGAHSAITSPIPPTVASTTASTISSVTGASALAATVTSHPASHVTIDGGKMYYCWTHGLSINSAHTSGTCNHKADGHNDTATAFKMHGGNNKINGGRNRRPPNPRA